MCIRDSNRSCKKSGSKVYFFNIDDASGIYKNDFRKQKHLTLIDESIQELLENKDFESYYDKVIYDIEESKKECNDNNIDKFLQSRVGSLDFAYVRDKMKLIDKVKEYTIFLNIDIELENGKIISGNEVWESYKSILKNNNINYAQKRIELSKVMEHVDYFTYKLRKFTNSYSDCIGDIFYIDDGEKYFTNGKFDRSKLDENIDSEWI